MRFSSILMALTGLAVAGGSAYAARDFLESQQETIASEEAPVVQVVAAARDIPFGMAIEAHMLTSIAWPRDAVPPGVFTNYDALISGPGGEPRRAKRSISQGELLLANKVSAFGEKVTIVQTLSPNNRAMAITVNAETAVGGFVTPGDYVDIVLTHSGGNSGLSATTILQNIRIIGVDQDANEESDKPGIARTVTVEVTPDQSQRLALAQRAGSLSLTLRNRLEAEEEEMPLESLRLSDLFYTDPPVVADAEGEIAVRPTREITVRRGNVPSIVELR
jgi:pilus assembly protein CpaB